MGQARTVLELVSSVEQVTSGAPDACQEFLISLARARQWASGMWVIGQDGRVRCATVPNAARPAASKPSSATQSVIEGGRR